MMTMWEMEDEAEWQRNQKMTDPGLDDLIAYQQERCHGYPYDVSEDHAILARLVSLRDAGKELPVEPDTEQLGVEALMMVWSMRPSTATPEGKAWEDGARRGWKWRQPYIDALRAHAVAARARVKELEPRLDAWVNAAERIVSAEDAAIVRDVIRLEERAKSLQSRVSELEAERCEHCGAKVYSGPPDCPRCGAPQCCPQCCKIDRLEAEREHNDAEHKRLVRELDVIINGESGAAPQASLCDIVAQVRAMLAKLREPTKEMCEAGGREFLEARDRTSTVEQRSCADFRFTPSPRRPERGG